MSEESGYLFKQVERPSQALHTEIEAPISTADYSQQVSLCCHDVKKQNALL